MEERKLEGGLSRRWSNKFSNALGWKNEDTRPGVKVRQDNAANVMGRN